MRISSVRLIAGAFALMALSACGRRPSPEPTPTPGPAPEVRPRPIPYAVIPAPSQISVNPADTFLIAPTTPVVVDADASAEVEAIGTYTAQLIATMAGAKARRLTPGAGAPDSSIVLRLDASRTKLGDEGYELRTSGTQVEIIAAQPAGLFHGVQTFRQLLPASVEHPAAAYRRLMMPRASVTDVPRFAWRGFMLDVSRHFLEPEDVKHFIDVLALYKFNRLHLHLSDDQGWRIEIKSWPKLATVGGATQIGGGVGGYYTQGEYADIVAYAKSRYITVVPEIDMPGHITATLIAYPDLRCDRTAPEPFMTLGGPPNVLCTTRDSVYKIVADVIGEISAAAPTPYFHIGGDEVASLSDSLYISFIDRVQKIVDSIGPRMIGWGEIAPANLSPRTILQHWTPKDSAKALMHVQRGGQIILSPGPHAYVDMKYDSATVLGLRWAGLIPLRAAYDWNPATEINGVGLSSILGIEANLFAETVITRQDYEYMAFPRLLAISELAWSHPEQLGWEGFRRRVGQHGARLAAIGVNFARVPGIDWRWH